MLESFEVSQDFQEMPVKDQNFKDKIFEARQKSSKIFALEDLSISLLHATGHGLGLVCNAAASRESLQCTAPCSVSSQDI